MPALAPILRDDLDEYDVRMRALLPKLLSAQAAASGVSEAVFARIDPMVKKLMRLDVAIGTAGVQIKSDATAGQRALQELQGPAFDLTNEIVRQVSSYLRVDRQADVWGGEYSRTNSSPNPPS